MQTEYEAKFLDINEEDVKKKIQSLGAELVKPRQLFRRVIFENDITAAKHSWVRLRDEGDKITLTLKQVSDTTTIEGTKEIEIKVDDLDKTTQFLEGIGLKRKRYQENYREEWKLGNVVVDFDLWPDMPMLLEIEGPDEPSVKQVVAQLGFDYSQARFGSIDTIYFREHGRDILAEETLLFKKESRS